MSSRRKIRVRYTLRSLLVFITLFALWGGYHANRGWKERRAVEVLRKHGAQLGWGASLQGGGMVSLATGAYSLMVGAIWGDHCVGEVQVLAPLDGEIADALAELP